MGECLLFVVAHADDLEIGAGGTCAKLVDAGYDVRVVVVTDDQKQATAERRRHEAIAGAAALGVRREHVRFLGLPDGYVDCNPATVGALRRLMAEHGITPTAIFTHTDADSHQDHIQTLRLVRAAVRGAAIFRFPVRNSFMASAFSPSVFVTIDAVLARKERALSAHATQESLQRIQARKVRDLSAQFAAGRRGRFCEPFELDIQNDLNQTSLARLLQHLDSDPFNRLWAPLLSSGKLSILIGDLHAPTEVSAIELVARLQARLMGISAARLGAPAYARIDVTAATDTALQEASGHILLLGLPTQSPRITAALEKRMSLSAATLKSQGGGLVTVSAREIAWVAAVHPLLITVTGTLSASCVDAARALLETPGIDAVCDAATDVLSGASDVAIVDVTADALPLATSRAKPKAKLTA